jgi:hypothetical protein
MATHVKAGERTAIEIPLVRGVQSAVGLLSNCEGKLEALSD